MIEKTEERSLPVVHEKILAVVREMLGADRGREDDEHPLRPGPWGPVIRQALERAAYVLGPSPEPWKTKGSNFGYPVPWIVLLTSILAGRRPELYDAIGGGHTFGQEASINPQPLPPRSAFLAALVEVVRSHAELLQEVADATSREGTQQGIIIVGGYTMRFADEWCGNGFRLHWPFPGPPPPWFTSELHAIDLLILAANLDRASQEAFSHDLRRHLSTASAKFLEAGSSMLK